MLWLCLFLAACLIIGSAMILLRTAKPPKIPPSVKAQPYEADDND